MRLRFYRQDLKLSLSLKLGLLVAGGCETVEPAGRCGAGCSERIQGQFLRWAREQ